MATEVLIDFFKNSEKDSFFSFQPFFVNFFSNKSPKKIKLEYNQIIDEKLYQLKDSIVTNFYLNKYFNSVKAFEFKAVKKLIDVLQNKDNNEDNIATHLLLLHLSKSKLTQKQFEAYFNQIDTIQVIPCFKEIFSFEEFFEKLKKNRIFLNAIENILKTEANLEPMLETVRQTKLVHFKSKIYNLNSFAGLQKIYINSSRIEQLRSKMTNLETENQATILKFYLIKLIINHLVLMSILASKNDINVSSEYLAIQPKEYDLTKIETLAEKLIFKVSIDWHKSVESPNLNLKYLRCFYENLMEGGELKEFDFEKSGVVVEMNAPCLFGIEQNFVK
ncbi:hypothetical protein BpHYR1_020397 [Brachionus plicatilis]|uniref:Uncharacterized protein n=1 Tax=Brachionus plicatilis TaxID=10195 RepID=A0A3M7R702_BRAPC|nr:hypothetical protein BpHYR1_020397 [Brachionus plicatilis]